MMIWHIPDESIYSSLQINRDSLSWPSETTTSFMKKIILISVLTSLLTSCSSLELAIDRAQFEKNIEQGNIKKALPFAHSSFVNNPINGKLPILHALYGTGWNNYNNVRYLIKKGAVLPERLPSGESPAYYAAKDGAFKSAQLFVDNGGGTLADIQRGRSEHSANMKKSRREWAEFDRRVSALASRTVTCPQCGGAGHFNVTQSANWYTETKVCPTCGGKGKCTTSAAIGWRTKKLMNPIGHF